MPGEEKQVQPSVEAKNAKRILSLLSNAAKLQCQAQISTCEAARLMKKEHPGALLLLIPSIDLNEKQVESLRMAARIVGARLDALDH